jgi:NAD(P)-dependent dehydrogenase (short-subunit alcohol dehydrogenase family)
MPASHRRPIALITGAKRGIGKGIALELAARGFEIVLNDLEYDQTAQETLEQVMQLGTRAKFVAADIANLDGHEPFVQAAFDAFGTLDCVVNNAGVSVLQRGDLLEVTPSSFDRVMGINLRGTFFLTQAIAKRMLLETRSNQDPARTIICISSFNALGVSIDRAEYTISKSSLSMMVKLFAVRLAAHGIGVFEVRPGIIRTDMTVVATEKYDRLIEGGLTPMPRWGEAADVGRAVAALSSGDFAFSVGEVIHVDGGLGVPRL